MNVKAYIRGKCIKSISFVKEVVYHFRLVSANKWAMAHTLIFPEITLINILSDFESS